MDPLGNMIACFARNDGIARDLHENLAVHHHGKQADGHDLYGAHGNVLVASRAFFIMPERGAFGRVRRSREELRRGWPDLPDVSAQEGYCT